jgi:hypothetical protein
MARLSLLAGAVTRSQLQTLCLALRLLCPLAERGCTAVRVHCRQPQSLLRHAWQFSDAQGKSGNHPKVGKQLSGAPPLREAAACVAQNVQAQASP